MRLIDADALMVELMDSDLDHLQRDDWKEVIQIVADAPTIEQPQTGKWERHYSRPNVYADLYWHCSACGYKTDDQYAYRYHKFCPHCGARMVTE